MRGTRVFSVQWIGKVLQLVVVVPHPCLLWLLWTCSLGRSAGNRQGCCLQLRSEAVAGQCQPCTILHHLLPAVGWPGRDSASGAVPIPSWLVAISAHLAQLLLCQSCLVARGTGQEDLTRLQMEESGFGEELAAHPDGDKSERCQSHLQWKTTKWLVGRQLVDEGAGNCSSLLSPPPCIKTCSALLPSTLPGSTVSTRAGLFHGLHLAFSAYLVL